MASRQNDILNEHHRMLIPVEGYEDMPLVPLEDAVQPLLDLFDRDSLMGKVWAVKKRCRNPADGLSQDESASIMLYTCNWTPAEDSLFFILNESLRSENRGMLKRWFSYLRLLLGALSRLPPVKGTIYRGVKRNLSDEYQLGTGRLWWGFSSCTSNVSVLESESFCGKAGIRTMFLIQCFNGRNIQNHSYYYVEDEILLMPGRYLHVRGSYSSDDGLSIVQLDEIEPEYPLLKLPGDSWRHKEPGLSLLGICTQSDCAAYQKEVIIPIGFRKLDVLKECDLSIFQCPACKSYVDASKLGFKQCQWRLEGNKQIRQGQAPTRLVEDWSNTVGNSLLEYDLKGVFWRRLIVEATPKRSS